MSSPPPGGQSRRPRAPTITIDTSAVGRSSENLVQPEQDRRQTSAEGSSPMLRPTTGNSTPPELRKSGSFESRESRPTSPHNISSPTQVSHPQNFLAVPVQRKRGGSVDTDGGDTVSTTDTTYVGTDHQSPKVFGADDVKHGAGDHPVLSDKEALKPDPGTEADFERENNPFAFAPGHMTKLLNPKSLGAFHAMGGLAGLEKGLRSDRNSGLSVDEEELDGRVTFEEATAATSPAESDNTKVAAPPRTNSHAGAGIPQGSYQDRKRIFNDNRLPERKAKNIFQLAWMAYNDKILILLTVAAAIALALGIYQAVGQPHPPGEPGVEWVEGVAIIVAIVVVVSVGALNDWQKERQFVKLNKKKDARNVQVIRSGKAQEISVHDLLVGDLMVIEPGDILPVDGIYVTGHSVKCDESSATGESDILKKVGADEVFRAMENNENLRKMDPFMISGAKVTEGFGRMIVTATGIHSSYGKTMLALREDNEATPLQMKLNNLAEYIAKLGSAAALLLFVVLLIKFLAQLPGNNDSPADKGQRFLDILIVAVTIVVVAVPEGLPLAVTLALAFATKRMLKDNNLVRVMRSCETMGNATCVCSDKTGTLTQNVMTVVAGSIGTSSRFNNRADTQVEAGKVIDETEQAHDDVDDVTAPEFVKTLSEDTATLWKDAIAINSTAFEAEEEGKMVYVGSKTETALLGFARDFLGMDKIAIERSNAEIVQLIPFDSGRKCMGVVVKLPTGGYRLLVKGASEIMLRHCKHIIRDPTMGNESTPLSSSNKEMLEHLIDAYASRSLRTIGFIHRDFEAWPPKGARRAEDDRTQAVFEDVCKDMVFLGLVGIQDPLRPGVSESVADCIKAGVFPRMVTGDNINTAKAIAKECGIYTAGGLALEGPDFRKMSKHEQREIIPKLQVLARSSPEDKRILVRRLKEMGETVAVTGDGTNDAPALKAADVGFSMNIAGTEVAKEASDIILMDDNFTSIVKALMWGRAVNDAVRKFLQFQITVNITAVLLAFITAVASNQEESVLTAVQLLWVNLIMDTMAALALATDPPTRKILDRKPDPKSAPLISVTMWKMILGQAIYQLVITLVLNFAGPKIFHYDGEDEMEQLQTMVFNTFVWMQIFNSLNNRRLDNKFNIFEGIQRNWFFAGIFLIMVGGQTLIIFVGGRAFQVRRQFGDQWGVAIVLGAISIPIGIVIRLIPNELVVKLVPPFIKRWVNRPKKDELIVTDEENPWQFNQGLMDIKEELAWLRKYKGGRLRSLRFAVSHPKELLLGSRSPSRSRASSDAPGTPHLDASQEGDSASQLSHSPAPPTPDSRRRRNRSRSGSNVAFAGAAMAGIVAGSIGGWSPIERGRGDNDSLRFARERSKSDLSREVRRSAEVHPETRDGDPVVVRDPVVSAAEEGAMHPPSQANETTPAFGLGPFGDQPPATMGDEGRKDGKD